MEDLIIHLRGGQQILIRVDKSTWRRDPAGGGLYSLDLTYPEPIAETHQLNWVRLEAIDAIETRPVSNTSPDSPSA